MTEVLLDYAQEKAAMNEQLLSCMMPCVDEQLRRARYVIGGYAFLGLKLFFVLAIRYVATNKMITDLVVIRIYLKPCRIIGTF
jgi:hypothetical protein